MHTAMIRRAFLAATIGCVLVGCKPRIDPEATVQSAAGAGRGVPTWLERMGLSVTKAGDGLKVTDIEKVSPACVMGLKRNDVIVALNGLEVGNSAAFEAAANANVDKTFLPWCFTVKRGGVSAKLPGGCQFAEMRRDPQRRNYVCDPANMRICGPLTWECADHGG